MAAGCSHSKKSSAGLPAPPALNTAAAVPEDQQDGSSYEKAVVIKEKNESKGVAAEYAWLREHYPGYKSKGQSLNHKDKKAYDIITIVTRDGDEKQVYFDISGFFGRW